MKKWISVNTKLPKMACPVLCIVKTTCQCDHYIPEVLARAPTTHDGDWVWLANSPLTNDFVQIEKDTVKAWQFIDEFPAKYEEGFDR